MTLAFRAGGVGPKMPDRSRALTSVLLTLFGLVALGWVLHRAGPLVVLDVMGSASGPLLCVFVIEGARVGLDAYTTRELLRARGELTFGAVFVAQLASYPATLLLPAGRAAGEAVKASLLAPRVGVSRAAAAAVVAPPLALAATFVVSLPCLAAAAARWGAHPLTVAIGVQASTAVGLAVLLVLTARSPRVGWVTRRISARLGARVQAVQAEVTALPVVPRGALTAQICNRCLLVAQVSVLAAAVGVGTSLVAALSTAGVHLVGLAAGDAVPGQMGATDAAFALSSDSLGQPLAHVVGIPVMLHVVQLGWLLAGVLAPLRFRR
jgi:hypothetical protein